MFYSHAPIKEDDVLGDSRLFVVDYSIFGIRQPLENAMAAAEQPDSGAGKKKSGGIIKIAIWLIMVLVSVGGGFAAPLLIAKLSAPPEAVVKPEDHAPDPNEEVEFIDFEEVVAVLGKSKFSRYLKVSLSLQVAHSQRIDVDKKILSRSAVLRNRIIAHIAETSEEDLAGQHGQNQFRRQMHGFFNEILFEDGIERIQDVLFREFQVQ